MAQTSTRVFIDCAEFPSDADCSLYISGTPDEVMEAATAHAVSAHGHEDGPELRDQIKAGLKPEAA